MSIISQYQDPKTNGLLRIRTQSKAAAPLKVLFTNNEYDFAKDRYQLGTTFAKSFSFL